MYISTIAAALLAAIPTISALNYRGYSSTNSCSGSYGYSAQFENLPSGSQGQGYTNNGCSSFLFDLFGPGTKCWNGGGRRATNLNWFRSPSRIMARDANAIPNNNAAAAEKEKKCSPDGFSYPDEDGTMRDIKVEDAEHAELLAKQFQEGNLEALKVVAEFKH
ncbi:MAG: hypothetical protein LQ349_009761 [Xanthoria aureola]|nr:MAG: hypothetical protein LQ349_009761 [Xanthoria aureola]